MPVLFLNYILSFQNFSLILVVIRKSCFLSPQHAASENVGRAFLFHCLGYY